jgi:hypothetical protein
MRRDWVDIETIGAWGELIGGISGFVAAVGVILTLLYLAVQLRQNTEAVRTSTIQGVERGISELMASWTTSVEKAALVQKGFSSYEELTGDEKAFIQISFRRLILHMDTLFWSYRRGLLPEEIWQREESVLRYCLNSSGGRAAWAVGGFSEPFRQFVNTEILKP